VGGSGTSAGSRAGNTGGAVGTVGASAAGNAPSSAGKGGKAAEDPSLFKIQKVKGAFDKNALGGFKAKPVAIGNTAAHDWKAPKRSFKLKELSSRANTQKNTKTEAKVGQRKPKKSGPRSKAAKTGAIPRPTGAKGKFNPAAKTAKDILAFGRGAPVKAGKGAGGAGAAAGALGAAAGGKPTRGARAGAGAAAGGAAAAAPGAAAGARGGRGKKSMFVELSSSEEPSTPTLIKPTIEEGTIGLPDAPEVKPDLSHLAPCPANATAAASFIEMGADEVEPVMIEAHVDTVTVVQSEVHSLVEADVVGELAVGDLKLPSGIVVTAAQIAAITAAFAKQTSDRVWYHWADYQASIRWGRARKIDQGEVGWLNTQNAGMAAGGGYYLAQDPNGSRGYGPVPCYIFTKAGLLTMDINQAPIVKVLGKTLSNEDKAILGGVIPFIHSYNTANGWWVTHHADVLSNIRCGSAIISPDPLGPAPVLNPQVNADTYMDVLKANGGVAPAGARFVSVHFDGLNGQVVTARPIATQLDAHNYLLTMMSEKWDPANAQIGQEVANAASWVNSFFVLMQVRRRTCMSISER
jgi:hypothetical protein